MYASDYCKVKARQISPTILFELLLPTEITSDVASISCLHLGEYVRHCARYTNRQPPVHQIPVAYLPCHAAIARSSGIHVLFGSV